MEYKFDPTKKNVNYSVTDTVATKDSTGWGDAGVDNPLPDGDLVYYEFETAVQVFNSFGILPASNDYSSGGALDGSYRVNYLGQMFNPANNYLGDIFASNAVVGDIIGFAVNNSTKKMWVSKNGVFEGSQNPTAGTGALLSGWAGDWHPAVCIYDSGGIVTFRTKAAELNYSPPSGFTALSVSDSEGVADRYIPLFPGFPMPHNTSLFSGLKPAELIRQNRKGFSKAF